MSLLTGTNHYCEDCVMLNASVQMQGKCLFHSLIWSEKCFGRHYQLVLMNDIQNKLIMK